MASHLSSIGFPVETEDDFLRLQTLAADNGATLPAPAGLYVRWQAGEGAEVWVQVDEQSQIVGLNPHFAARSRLRVRVEARLAYPNESGLDGAYYAWALGDDESADGLYPFGFDAPDFALQRELALPTVVGVQLAAFAEELRYYPDDAAYVADQHGERQLAPEAFVPTGLFAAEEDEQQLPKPYAYVAGHVLATEQRHNPASGEPFLWLQLRSYGGTFELVADPTLLASKPEVGGVAAGVCWLSGRLQPADREEG